MTRILKRANQLKANPVPSKALDRNCGLSDGLELKVKTQ